jgi:glycosyltransferase involved in cell wall biosynthesis
MARLAFMSPWPPQPSGIATCAADVVPLLAAAGHGVDVLVDEALIPVTKGADGPPADGQVRVIGAHEFVWRQARGHYDLPVYQVGNSWAHNYVWPYLFRWPGLTVLHDARLHHSRASTLMARKRHDDYRAEFQYNHPGVSPDAAELAIAGFDGAYYYHWPMRRAVVHASRMVACHTRGMTRLLQEAYPTHAITHVSLGHGTEQTPADLAQARHRFRAACDIPDTAMVFGLLGTAAPEKRVAPVLRAFAAARQWATDARLLIAGKVDPLLPLDDLLDSFGVADVTHVAGRIDDRTFDDAVAACDVGLNLRWPTAREMSGPWLRMIAAGLPTVIVDAVHHLDLITLDPRTWRCHEPASTLEPHPELQAVAVAVDILDEDHSLRLALRRLASDAAFRAQLGATARTYWESNHTVAQMALDYERAIDQALPLRAPAETLPAHLRPNADAHAEGIINAVRGPQSAVRSPRPGLFDSLFANSD